MRLLLAILLSSTAQAGPLIYIGDSQSASNPGLLSMLRPTLEAQDRIVAGNAACGTKIGDHLNGGPAHCSYPGITNMTVSGGTVQFQGGGGHVSPIGDLMARAPSADTVIVELGDNHYGDPALAKKAREMATKILSAGKKCIWIGPAAIQGSAPACSKTLPAKRAVSETLSETLKSTLVNGKTCTFINSFKLTAARPPVSDDPLCIHYRLKGALRYGPWADAIRPALAQALASENAAGTDSRQPQNRRSVR